MIGARSLCIQNRIIQSKSNFRSVHASPFHTKPSTTIFRHRRHPININAKSEKQQTQQQSTTPSSPTPLPSFNEGLTLLLVVSVLWGSYTPTLRTIFTVTDAPSPLFVAAARGILQVSLLALATAAGFANNDVDPSKQQNSENSSSDDDRKLSPLVRGSLEIGSYNTMGTLLQTWGLSMTSATRGAFLIQATAIFTPILAAILGMAPSRTLWISSFVAFLATIFVAADQIGASSTLTTTLQNITHSTTTATTTDGTISTATAIQSILGGASFKGDLATLLAAFCYSLATVRIPTYTKTVAPLRLAFGKSAVLATVSSCALAWHILSPTLFQGLPLNTSELWMGGGGDPASNGVVVSLLVWSAVGPGALAAYCHVKGQSLVSPTEAQVVFSTVPLWSGLLAAVLVPGEQVGALTWVGGACMVVAGLTAAIPGRGGGGLFRK